MISQRNGAQIKHLQEFETETLFGAAITRLLSRERLSTVGFDHVRIPQGSALEPHIHQHSASFLYILEGTAVVILDGQQYQARAGDTIYIPPGVSHGFRTPDEAVVLLSVQSPPIYPEDRAPDITFSTTA
jgi:mannose-6-phosphate isomerase-like protein (cupin superfamily)